MQTTPNPDGAAHATTANNSTNVPTVVASENNTAHDLPEEGPWDSIKAWALRWRGSRRLVLVIVAIALLLDNMLLTVVGKYLALPTFTTLKLLPPPN